MSKAWSFAGIVRSDAAQRLSLFLPILAAFLIFHENPKSIKSRWYCVWHLSGLFCLLSKSNQQSAVDKKQRFFERWL